MEQTQNPAQIARLMNPEWKYRPACDTDIADTFERARQEQRDAEQRKQQEQTA